MSHESFSRQDEPKGSSDRGFGLVFCGFFLILAISSYFKKLPFSVDPSTFSTCPFWSAHPELMAYALPLTFLTVSFIFLIMALLVPKALAPLNWVWTRLGVLLHKFVSPIVLGILFFLVFTPIGIAIRVFGGDPLRLRHDSKAHSYWIVRSPPGPAPDSLKNQF